MGRFGGVSLLNRGGAASRYRVCCLDSLGDKVCWRTDLGLLRFTLRLSLNHALNDNIVDAQLSTDFMKH